ncbi:auxin-binding protein [Mesorhizobium sp. L-8-10]|uniref:FixH family protein n=1 Tax=Mesorhizobium sp. L-8-10 TaxID=2744523 RepID=UPI001926E61A|nr:FixH family protein [Mesorhizobium sp. L-8-10]BCH32162.1 auxin-binding protein [Mesorhizobium sp. L-8-10]
MKLRRAVLIAIALVAVGLAGWAAMHFLVRPPAELDLSRSKPSAMGLYSVAMAPEIEPVQRGPLQALVLTLATPDGKPVEGAHITVGGGMPQHGHGLPTSPEVTAYLGDGRYRVEGVRFNMSGWWELKFAISASPGDDSVTFNLVL